MFETRTATSPAFDRVGAITSHWIDYPLSSNLDLPRMALA
ncbi:hypothetical protein C427_2367 [Paraglaciecola psychrophila 170]|jgi:hypothetical protein|uniref:Uncharacterized protein n=1 Tax=Paraglaciecola psychrophila 170 TaxID=1129794 RepID=K6YZ37_9ALTE|nr:hypothetical protein C427_2367 [Paraglaciecola psychrophila 170]GAC38019.1 hypothetical protein GPSY_2398 [Paraglaciecola psychrophila 170]